MIETEVLVVGAGNSAMCAALAARDAGADVLVLERAPEGERGGNTAFTAGAMRTVYDGVADLRSLIPDLTAEEIENTDFGAYPAEAFYADMERVTDYRADPDLVEVMVSRSHETLTWMAGKGIRFAPAYGRQAFKVDGRFRFWGGLTVEVVGGGPGLVESEHKIAAKDGVDIRYNSRAIRLLADDSGIHGVVAVVDGVTTEIRARAVVLACGGFQANAEWRTRYLGPGWDLAKVRGTRFNTGEGHRMALEAGASPAGNWSGCHAVGWDRNAPEYGDLAVGDGFQKHSYPLGIMVNADGRRFVDEGADFRNYTYAKYGRRILEQPSQFAWQVFDQQVVHLLRDEYRIREVTRVQAATLDELAHRLDGVNPEGFLAEVAAFNASVDVTAPFDPTVKDGRGTVGLAVPKSNWANPLTEGPFLAFQVTCGVTFTFGGIRITPQARVVSAEGSLMPGLFACGEIIGGLFYHNYPGGTGLTAGSVFGRVAGTNAAREAAWHGNEQGNDARGA
ncbi:MAG TPA: FAD-dependent tricarballylate dehydrogenase TcuA [Trebonia sp.]|jgi:tricarballylate dehydrogenase|nr:FAD-dependent tricarballylate dehydrogenase TcuA [Trebonia sp.]